MNPSVPFVVIVFGGLVVAATPARADIAPDPDSADANCSPAQQCPTGVLCDYSFHPGQPESEWQHVGADCRSDATKKGLERRCRDGGNYGGKELYCPSGATGSWSPPGQKVTSTPEPAPAPKPGPAPGPGKSGSCAVNRDASTTDLVWLLGALWLGRRRRRG